MAASADATATVNGEIITARLEFRARDIVLFNTLGVLTNWKITVGAQQYKEWKS